MKTDLELQNDILASLKWEPVLKSSEIGVSVLDGVVTLTGTVDNYIKKIEAEIATKKVAGVLGVVDKIVIKHDDSVINSDEQIEKDIMHSLDSNWDIPDHIITVESENGWVTLEGEVKWNYQKESVKSGVSRINGVKGITNNIVIVAPEKEVLEKKSIVEALARNWAINDKDIHVIVNDDTVTLKGTVATYFEKEETERVVWKTPGITKVINELHIHK